MMMIRILALLFVGSAAAFAPQRTNIRSATSELKAMNDEQVRQTAAKFFAGAFLLSNLATVAPAFAAFDDFGSSQVLAARSGGRAGGRAARAPSRTTYKSTTIYQSAPAAPSAVYVAPPSYGYGYNPMPGLGLGLGLNAIGAVGEGMREYRQESEIRESRNELQQARMKEQELEMRLRQLEAAQQRAP